MDPDCQHSSPCHGQPRLSHGRPQRGRCRLPCLHSLPPIASSRHPRWETEPGVARFQDGGGTRACAGVVQILAGGSRGRCRAVRDDEPGCCGETTDRARLSVADRHHAQLVTSFAFVRGAQMKQEHWPSRDAPPPSSSELLAVYFRRVFASNYYNFRVCYIGRRHRDHRHDRFGGYRLKHNIPISYVEL